MADHSRIRHNPNGHDFFAPKPRAFEAFLRWFAYPKAHRYPATKKALAEQLGVNPSTLWRWEKSQEAEELKEQVARRLEPALEAVLDALAESAKVPGAKGHADRKEFLRLLGVHTFYR